MAQIRLTTNITGQTDLARVIRELSGLNDFFIEAKVRSGGTAMQLPKLSRMLDQLARDNHVNLLDSEARTGFLSALQDVYQTAPKLHISFAAEPPQRAFEKILEWIRLNIHPQALVQVGLQPAIAAGCVLRTPNRVFDMSLRTSLEKQEAFLTQLIKGAVDGR